MKRFILFSFVSIMFATPVLAIDPDCDPVTGGPFFDPAVDGVYNAKVKGNQIWACTALMNTNGDTLQPGDYSKCTVDIEGVGTIEIGVTDPGQQFVVGVPTALATRTVSNFRCIADDGTLGEVVVDFPTRFRPGTPGKPSILN